MKSFVRICVPIAAGLLIGSMTHASDAPEDELRKFVGILLDGAQDEVKGEKQGPAISLGTAEGRLTAYRKVQCSMIDGKESFYWWTGLAYGHVAGQPDLRLFRVEGINVRRCATVPDAERGDGFRLITREVLVYQDPETGEMLHTWDNPYTGETVEVVHVANDPVNQPSQHPLRRDGSEFQMPMVTQGNDWWWTAAVPLFYNNPLAGEYQKYVGGTYHATEMFNFKGKLDDLLDAEKDSAGTFVGWVRLAQWLPWMEMGSRTGKMYFHAGGKKVGDYENVPASFRAVIEEHFPLYRHAPPMDDDRPNETSWTYFKKVVDARED